MKYQKKPVVVDCFKWTGDVDQKDDPEWIVKAIEAKTVEFENAGTEQVKLVIHTLEGDMVADRGDYIIQGVHGELYPCKPDIFKETYEPESVVELARVPQRDFKLTINGMERKCGAGSRITVSDRIVDVDLFDAWPMN
ncbi:prophage P2a protein 33 [Lactobacillus plantarum 16] [Lactiplantibacillus mudanjiangensis]|nr:prophage P2a protein 33 [Lactobacillus plantarum 16] [Lactiplantibacillus mudanjiangensis]